MPICKLAVQTALRWGWINFLLLTVGIYFLLSACCLFLNYCSETMEPWEYKATSIGEVSLEKIANIEVVAAITPVISFDTTVTWEKYSLDTSIVCVTAEYLNLDLESGALFPNDSSMPFLIMNEWATEHFCDEDDEQAQEIANVGDTLTIVMQEEKYIATISGVFCDGEERAVVYMSYSQAARILPATSNFLARLRQRGSLKEASALLEQQGISVAYDDAELLRWDMMKNQMIQMVLCSIAFFSCGILRLQQAPIFAEQEIQLLKLSGLTEADIKWICFLRTTFAYAGCLLFSFAVGACFEQDSLLGIVTSLCIFPIIVIGGKQICTAS